MRWPQAPRLYQALDLRRDRQTRYSGYTVVLVVILSILDVLETCAKRQRIFLGSHRDMPKPPGGNVVLLSAVDVSLDPITKIDGFVLGCLVDLATGMVLASVTGQGDISPPTVAAGAADIANVLSVMSARVAAGEELEDVIVTFSSHLHLVRLVNQEWSQRVILLVILDRRRANLAMARRELRSFCASVA